MNCIACKSEQTNALRKITSPFEPVDYMLYECSNCKSRFFSVDREKDQIAAVYDEHAVNTADVYDIEFKESPYWRCQVNTLLYLSEKPVNSVLDVGCRTGDFLLHWPEDTLRVGVELSSNWAFRAEKRGLTVKQDFLENVEFDKPFDVVTCYAVLEHLRDPIKFLADLPDIVSDGGVAVIMIPTYQCILEKILWSLRQRWHMYCPPQHINFLSREKLDDIMRMYGFDVIDRRYSSGGMFNPFRKVPIIGKVFNKLAFMADYHSLLQHTPIFDHMFSYYKKNR